MVELSYLFFALLQLGANLGKLGIQGLTIGLVRFLLPADGVLCLFQRKLLAVERLLPFGNSLQLPF